MQKTHPSVNSEEQPLWHPPPKIVKWPRPTFGVSFQLADMASILIIPIVGSLLRQDSENLERNLSFWTLLALFTITLIASHGGYQIKNDAQPRRQIRLAVGCFLATSVAMLTLADLLGHGHILTRRWTFADLIITPAMMSFGKVLLRKKISENDNISGKSGALVICYDHCPPDLPRALFEQNMAPKINSVIYLSSEANPHKQKAKENFNNISNILQEIRINNIQDIIFIHHPYLDSLSGTEHQLLMSELLVYPARIWLALDVASNVPELLKHRSSSYKIVPIVTNDLVSSLNLTKRVFDIIVSLMVLLLLCPVFILVAGLVKASGPGPIIFRQVRTGAHNRPFTVLKFRTMSYEPGLPFSPARVNDPRITKVGRFLRRSSIDELLQIFNVLQGDMSLVGPRPHAPETEVDGINFENAVRLYRLRHRVKPGITGLAQIRGQRGETCEIKMLEQRLASDLEYIQSWSLWRDIVILAQTLPVIFTQKNAL